ncbi:MAG: hypothetical protein HY885_04015 [Deltaproteobacteria bacterium]|nr:hypothetical protein [Deltaproteobacteria bacterium]
MDKDWVRAITKAKWLVIALMVVLSCFSACTDSVQLPRAPLHFPFEVQRAGNKIETELQVLERREYSFSLRFGFKENDEVDRARVKKLVGDHMIDKYGKLVEPGIPIPLRLRINVVDVAGERTIFEKEISEQGLWAWGGVDFAKLIESMILKPGHYRISVETLKDIPELIGIPVTFNISFGHSK